MRKITRHDVDVFFAISAALSDLPTVQARMKELAEQQDAARAAVEALKVREAAFAYREADIKAREDKASKHEAEIAEREVGGIRALDQRGASLAAERQAFETSKANFAKAHEDSQAKIKAQLDQQATRAAEFETEMAGERDKLAAERADLEGQRQRILAKEKALEADSERLDQQWKDLRTREAAHAAKIEKLDQLAPKFKELLS